VKDVVAGVGVYEDKILIARRVAEKSWKANGSFLGRA
jgi:hypothetical protein